MKKIMLAVTILAAVAVSAMGQSWTMPNLAYFGTNVYLHDAPTVPLHTRVPTGAVAQVVGNVLYPVGNLSLHGNLTVETNRTFTMSHKPDVSDVTNSIVIDANGQIILRRWVTGTGWIEATINPTNPLPAGMFPTGAYVRVSGDTMIGALTFDAANTNALLLRANYGYLQHANENQWTSNGPWRRQSYSMATSNSGAGIYYNTRHSSPDGTNSVWSGRDVYGPAAVFNMEADYEGESELYYQISTYGNAGDSPTFVRVFQFNPSISDPTNARGYIRSALAIGSGFLGGEDGYMMTVYTNASRTNALYVAGQMRMRDTYQHTGGGSVYAVQDRDDQAKDTAYWYKLQGTNSWLVGAGPTIAGGDRYGWTRWNGSAWRNAGHFDDDGKLILSNGLVVASAVTATQTFVDASSAVRTNIYVGGILVSGYTE